MAVRKRRLRKRNPVGDPSPSSSSSPSSSLPSSLFFPTFHCCYFYYGLPTLLAIACHLNGLEGDFVFDDVSAVVENGDVTGGPTLAAFGNNFWGEPMGDSLSKHESYRPIVVFTYALNWRLSSSPFGFHAVNVAIHCATTCALVVLVRRIMLVREANMRAAGVGSCIAGLLFASHPVHVESVIGIVGRCELLAGLFYILAVLAYTSSVLRKSWKYHAIACALIATSTMCKEQGITAGAACVVLDVCMACDCDFAIALKVLGPGRLRRRGSAKDADGFAARTYVLGAFLFVLLLVRLSIMKGDAVTFDWQTNPANHGDTFLTRAMSKAYYAALHFGLLAWPSTLSCDRSGHSIPLIESPLDIRNGAFVTLALISIAAAARSLARKHALCLLALCTLFVPFLPAAGLFFNVGFTVAERVMYIPSMGACILVARFVHRWRAAILIPVVAAVVGLLSKRTWDQNQVWTSESSLYLSALEAYPSNAKAHFNYAASIMDKDKELEDVIEKHLKEAISLNELYTAPYINLGVLYAKRGALDAARDVWESGLASAKKSNSVRRQVHSRAQSRQAEETYLVFSIAYILYK